MQNKDSYEFAVIRVVPKVEREEFMNVGVIMYSKPNKFLEMKYHLNHEKLKAFSEDLDINAIDEYLKAWELVCKGGPKGGKIGSFEIADRFRWLTACRSTIIQSSNTHPGLSKNPQQELEKLFAMYVI